MLMDRALPWKTVEGVAPQNGSRLKYQKLSRHSAFGVPLIISLLACLALANGFTPILRTRTSPRTCMGKQRGYGGLKMAEDEQVSYMTWLSRKVEKAARPATVNIRRARLTKDFAVLLMRSSYQVCDDLDFVPMDEFQKKFFLLRQDEWSDYKERFPGIKQGDLTDPDYFDFISFAQYASVAEAMRNGRDIFEEKVGAEGEKRTVQRNPDYADNSLLPAEHSRRVGDKMLAYIVEAFGSTKLGPVIGQGLGIARLTEGCERIMNLLRLNFYLLDYTVSSDPDRRLLIVKAVAPATIWGQQVLVKRKDRPVNDFEAKVISAYLRACGKVRATYSTKFSALDVTHVFQL